MSAFQRQASDSLRQASVAAITPTDRSALQLLTNEFNNMHKWRNQMIAQRKTLQYVSADQMNGDPLFPAISYLLAFSWNNVRQRTVSGRSGLPLIGAASDQRLA